MQHRHKYDYACRHLNDSAKLGTLCAIHQEEHEASVRQGHSRHSVVRQAFSKHVWCSGEKAVADTPSNERCLQHVLQVAQPEWLAL